MFVLTSMKRLVVLLMLLIIIDCLRERNRCEMTQSISLIQFEYYSYNFSYRTPRERERRMSLDGMKDKSRQLITSRVTYKQALERTTFETSNEVTRSTSFNGMKDFLFSFTC